MVSLLLDALVSYTVRSNTTARCYSMSVVFTQPRLYFTICGWRDVYIFLLILLLRRLMMLSFLLTGDYTIPQKQFSLHSIMYVGQLLYDWQRLPWRFNNNLSLFSIRIETFIQCLGCRYIECFFTFENVAQDCSQILIHSSNKMSGRVYDTKIGGWMYHTSKWKHNSPGLALFASKHIRTLTVPIEIIYYYVG